MKSAIASDRGTIATYAGKSLPAFSADVWPWPGCASAASRDFAACLFTPRGYV